ncbi:MAG TPA: ImmA/IrrE family metallo-endopeptidase [Pyrinomonadaceae bacterium]|jgi:Zn-dependent peptidase ImmA (M78 family)
MAQVIQAFVKPELLVWAREDAGYDIEVAARRINVKPEKLTAVEGGQARLTVNQLRNLSNVYKRPLAFFYLPAPPQTDIYIKDFRHFSEESEHKLSPELRLELRKAKARREAALGLLDDLDITPTVFVSTASTDENPESVGKRIREILDISFERQSSLRTDYEALHFWRDSIEACGVFVFQASIPKSEMRGCSIWYSPLPIIIMNAKDSPYGRVFTMAHELTHLMLRSAGLCDLGSDKIEVFCNAVAGEALVPSELFLRESIVRGNGNHGWSDEELNSLSSRYSVSTHVILLRLLSLGKTTQDFYQSKIEEWKKLKKPPKGFAPVPLKAVAASGKTFVRLVLDSYHQNRISSTDAAQYLGVKLKHLGDIEKAVRIPSIMRDVA